MIIKPFLSSIEGILHCSQPYQSYTKPEIIINNYSTGLPSKDFELKYGPINLINLEETREYSGRYCFKKYNIDPYTYIDTLHGPKTESTKTFIIDIPCPKVKKRINTRWNNGRWEKELKKGWCSA